jgi:hypothetical protein
MDAHSEFILGFNAIFEVMCGVWDALGHSYSQFFFNRCGLSGNCSFIAL